MKMRTRMLAVLAAVLAIGSLASAGEVRLKDGTRIEGDLRRATGGWEVVGSDGVTRFVAEDQVAAISTGSGDTSGDAGAAGRVASLRRAVEAMDDIPQIIARYEALLPQVEKTPAAEEIRGEITKWRQMQERGMVKVGRQWVDPAGLENLEEQHFAAIENARRLLGESKLREAGPIIDKVLAENPQHVGALYLKAALSYRMDQLPPARRAMEQVVAALPTHWPSVHNLAVLQWRQRSQAVALANFDKVMEAMPLVPEIHDNVIEVINTMTPEMRNSLAGRRLLSRFLKDEVALKAEMAKRDRYRWGAVWVTSAQLKDLKDQEAQIQAQLDDLSKEFDEAERGIQAIDDEITSINRTLASLENRAWVRDADGRMVQMAYPPSWHQLNRDVDALRLRRDREMSRLDQIRTRAERAKRQIAVPPFTGRLRLLDEQYTPTLLRAGAADATADDAAPVPAAQE